MVGPFAPLAARSAEGVAHVLAKVFGLPVFDLGELAFQCFHLSFRPFCCPPSPSILVIKQDAARVRAVLDLGNGEFVYFNRSSFPARACPGALSPLMVKIAVLGEAAADPGVGDLASRAAGNHIVHRDMAAAPFSGRTRRWARYA